jgi:hypothetical protein
MITLTQEQARVLAETTESPLRVVDPQTQHIYFFVSGEVYARAQALVELHFPRTSDENRG